MSKLTSCLLAAAAALVPLAPAIATAEPMREASRVHDFHTVDRFTPQSTFGFNLGYEMWDDADFTILGFDVGGHFVSEAGAGGYVVLPLAYVATDDVVVGGIVITEGESEVVLGNIEVGGLYAKKLDRRTDLVVRAGLALPTGPEAALDAAGLLSPLAAVPRHGDLPQHWNKSMWLRLGASPMGHFGPVFWRVDAGLDLMLADDDGATSDISPVFRLNVAGGVDIGDLDVTAELATNITDPENDNADETASTFALGGRFTGGSVQPGLALIFPVGYDDLDDLDMAIAFSLIGHMQ
jgi:hypothetical protein